MTQPSTLDAWLARAARGIIPEDRERIRDEVRAHVREVLEAEGIAEYEAVKRLGDPKKANRRYRKTNITKRDEKWLRRWVFSLDDASNLFFSGLLLLFAYGLIFFLAWPDIPIFIVPFALLGLAATSPGFIEVLAARRRRRVLRDQGFAEFVQAEYRRQRIGRIVQAVLYCGWFGAFAYLHVFDVDRPLAIGDAFAFFIATITLGLALYIRWRIDGRRLQKLSDASPETIHRLMEEEPGFLGKNG